MNGLAERETHYVVERQRSSASLRCQIAAGYWLAAGRGQAFVRGDIVGPIAMDAWCNGGARKRSWQAGTTDP